MAKVPLAPATDCAARRGRDQPSGRASSVVIPLGVVSRASAWVSETRLRTGEAAFAKLEAGDVKDVDECDESGELAMTADGVTSDVCAAADERARRPAKAALTTGTRMIDSPTNVSR